MIYRPLLFLFILLIIKALGVIALIVYSPIGLSPDEAQYWTWSRDFDWGYYSKPPGIAWQIGLFQLGIGTPELSVRFSAIVVGFFLPLSVYFLAKKSSLCSSTAFWAGVMMALSPLGILSSFFSITDGGMVLFWTLACAVMASSLCINDPINGPKSNINYYLLGLTILLGALFKWLIYLFWVPVAACLLFFRSHYRNIPARGNLAVAIAISLLGLLPSIIWNYSHNWATFRHVLATIEGKKQNEAIQVASKGNFFEFIGAQAGLLSPILFVLLLISLIWMVRKRKTIPPPMLMCGMICLVFLFSYAFLGLFQRMQGNWVDYAYPSGIVFLAWFLCEKVSWGKRWMIGGLALSIVLTGVIFFAPLPYKITPFKHNLGWGELSPALESAGYDPSQDFLFGDRYQTSSLLSFYSPGQKRAYFLNINQIRHNQFSYWPQMAEEQLHKTGFFLSVADGPQLSKKIEEQREKYLNLLKPYFKEVEFLKAYPLHYSQGELVKAALIFKCIDYNGKEPQETALY
jgi:4-amino-4-deoxy-L-arabinose transferase-like glycosyltransferase